MNIEDILLGDIGDIGDTGDSFVGSIKKGVMVYNWYKRAKQEEDVCSRYVEEADAAKMDIMREFYEARKKGVAKPNSQPWTLIPAARLIKIWKDYARYGVVHDINGLNEIADRIIKNVARLAANTEFVGHTMVDPEEEYAEDFEYYGIKKKDMGRFMNFIQDDKFSDYALKPLQDIVFEMMGAKTPEQRLILIDRALNVIHQRGDISAIFVEGGRDTLEYLAGQGVEISASS